VGFGGIEENLLTIGIKPYLYPKKGALPAWGF
jgi:hypothetical protein